MIVLKNVWAKCSGEPVLKNATLQLKPGKAHVMMEPNGSGKNTTMKLILGSSL